VNYILDNRRLKFEIIKPQDSMKVSIPKHSKILDLNIDFDFFNTKLIIDIHFAAPEGEKVNEDVELCYYTTNAVVQNLQQLRFYKRHHGVFAFIKVVPDSN
jgi:hypothetical protein